MKRLTALTAVLALLGWGVSAWAGISVETVPVGDAGNKATQPVYGVGSVQYDYRIGKYEVTAGQYTAFLNAVAATDTYGLYNEKMDTAVSPYGCNIKRAGVSGSYSYSVAPDWANRPVNYVSWGDSARFSNWLHNGQLTGAQDATTTEGGAYSLNGAVTNAELNAVTRNADWKWAITSRDEWYKSAFYKGGSYDAGYWSCPTQSNSAPGRDMADATGNNANYSSGGHLIGSPYYRTEVGEFQNSASAYGTFDQGGNVFEWTESMVPDRDYGGYRVFVGGSFDTDVWWTTRGAEEVEFATSEYYHIGFRVSEVPEPSSVIALLGGLAALLGARRRKA